ncbi:hypothetical protein [Spiroplasma sp. SV19]|uniref:hypothetical protein n=1 Tax=Spiroplasma sp. SV19 TaxID=2570468 RepID=UPI0024B78EA2|nr:hypothetical protein [Spiroplasma sp. SV19]
MANHSLVLDKRKMQLVCRIFEKYKAVFLLKEKDIKYENKHKYILFDNPRYAKLEEEITKNLAKKDKEDWSIEKIQLRNSDYRVNLNKYPTAALESLEEYNFIWDKYNQTKYLNFIYNYPTDRFNEEYKNKIKEKYTIAQRINDLIIFFKNSMHYDYDNKQYSEYADDFIYEFKKIFNIHEIRAWYRLDSEYVFHCWMKDALANYDKNIHYDISWNEYKQMCKDIFETKYGAEDEENKYFFFRNC